MEIDYLIGSKKEFDDFVYLITPVDRVAILTHIDLDGLASALFLEKILEAKRININYLDFLDIKSDMLKEVIMKLKESRITKVFICDIGVDSIDLEGFRELRQEMDVFLIDHHPQEETFFDKRNVIKTASGDCSGMVCFFLEEEAIDAEAWRWLVCSAMFSDYSYVSEKNLDYIKSIYPEVTKENISGSLPGINARKIAAALIYYEHDRLHVYKLVKERKMAELTEAYEIIEDEINRLIEDFSIRRKYYPEKNLYFYEIDSRFALLSNVTSIVSKMKSGSSFVFMQRREDQIKFSARSHEGLEDMGALMKKCTSNLEGSSGGGHRAAAAAQIKPEYLSEFLKRLTE